MRRRACLDEGEMQKIINENFHQWFQNKVLMNNAFVLEDIKTLGRGPNKVAKRCSGFIRKGVRFHTLSREEQRVTQNSGVVWSMHLKRVAPCIMVELETLLN